MTPIVWLIIMVVFVVIEIATLGLTTIWFAAGALVAFLLSLADLHVAIQGAAFIFVSLLSLAVTRPVAMKYLNRNTAKTNVESIIGRTAVVTETICNLRGTGHVKIDSTPWMARSLHDGVIIEAGEHVIVRGISGVKTIVEIVKEDEKC